MGDSKGKVLVELVKTETEKAKAGNDLKPESPSLTVLDGMDRIRQNRRIQQRIIRQNRY